jgi:hypothetical protein
MNIYILQIPNKFQTNQRFAGLPNNRDFFAWRALKAPEQKKRKRDRLPESKGAGR